MLLCAASYAQVEQSPMPKAESLQHPDNQSMPSEDEEVTILRDEYAGKYNLSTLENLSKLYWRLKAFDFDDEGAVGNFIKINDCKIYTEYLNDDLEWRKILQVMAQHLKDNQESFPVNFQFMLQLHLGRYDPDLGGFSVVDKTGFKDAKRIEVSSIDREDEICFDDTTTRDYPKSVVMLLNQPFTLDFLKMDEHVAQAYILRKKSEYSALNESVRVQRYERDAYLRLRVTFLQYDGNLRGRNDQPMAILFANIDGYEVFEDSDQKRLMLSVNYLEGEGASSSTPQIPAMHTP